MVKKILFFIVLYSLICVNIIAHSDIIPLKKPIQSEEQTKKKLLVDVIKPLPKPINKIETKIIKEEVVVKKKIKKGLILPKKKAFNSRV